MARPPRPDRAGAGRARPTPRGVAPRARRALPRTRRPTRLGRRVRHAHARSRARERAAALAPGRVAAVRGADRDQGPEPDRRGAHDLRLGGVPRLRARRLRRCHARDRGRGHGQHRQDQHPGVRLALLHRARRWRRRRSRRTTGAGWRAAPPAARPRRSPPGWCPSPRAPTAAARSGSRRRAAAWSGSSRRAGGSADTRCTATRWAWRPPGRWPAPCATPRRCWTCWPAGARATRSGRRRRPRRSSPPATGSRAGCGSRGSSSR